MMRASLLETQREVYREQESVFAQGTGQETECVRGRTNKEDFFKATRGKWGPLSSPCIHIHASIHPNYPKSASIHPSMRDSIGRTQNSFVLLPGEVLRVLVAQTTPVKGSMENGGGSGKPHFCPLFSFPFHPIPYPFHIPVC